METNGQNLAYTQAPSRILFPILNALAFLLEPQAVDQYTCVVRRHRYAIVERAYNLLLHRHGFRFDQLHLDLAMGA